MSGAWYFIKDWEMILVWLSIIINFFLFIKIMIAIYQNYFKSQIKYFLVGFLVKKKIDEYVMLHFENDKYISLKEIKKMIKNKEKDYSNYKIAILSYTELNKEACEKFI